MNFSCAAKSYAKRSDGKFKRIPKASSLGEGRTNDHFNIQKFIKKGEDFKMKTTMHEDLRIIPRSR